MLRQWDIFSLKVLKDLDGTLKKNLYGIYIGNRKLCIVTADEVSGWHMKSKWVLIIIYISGAFLIIHLNWKLARTRNLLDEVYGKVFKISELKLLKVSEICRKLEIRLILVSENTKF